MKSQLSSMTQGRSDFYSAKRYRTQRSGASAPTIALVGALRLDGAWGLCPDSVYKPLFLPDISNTWLRNAQNSSLLAHLPSTYRTVRHAVPDAFVEGG